MVFHAKEKTIYVNGNMNKMKINQKNKLYSNNKYTLQNQRCQKEISNPLKET